MDLNDNLKNVNFKHPASLGLDKGSAIITYNKYKGYTLPAVILLINIILVIFVLIPQINQYLNSLSELDNQTKKLVMLKNNFNFLTSLDQTQSDEDLQNLTKVLPSQKDFLGIMTAVSSASSVSGIAINNYKFYPGNLTKLNGTAVQYPTLHMEMSVEGSGIKLNNFINVLYKTAPLVEISLVKLKDGKAAVNLDFYFKPFPPQTVSDDAPISALTQSEQKLINSLASWNNISPQDQGGLSGISLISTTSGAVNFNASASSQIQTSPFN